MVSRASGKVLATTPSYTFTPAGAINLTAHFNQTPTGASLFNASNTPAQTKSDGRPLGVGVKFTSSVAGQITALKFYRSPGDTGPNLLDLWTSTGTKLASVRFINTRASGWQTVPLPTPVTIAANRRADRHVRHAAREAVGREQLIRAVERSGGEQIELFGAAGRRRIDDDRARVVDKHIAGRIGR